MSRAAAGRLLAAVVAQYTKRPIGYACRHLTITLPAGPGPATNDQCCCTMAPIYL